MLQHKDCGILTSTLEDDSDVELAQLSRQIRLSRVALQSGAPTTSSSSMAGPPLTPRPRPSTTPGGAGAAAADVEEDKPGPRRVVASTGGAPPPAARLQAEHLGAAVKNLSKKWSRPPQKQLPPKAVSRRAASRAKSREGDGPALGGARAAAGGPRDSKVPWDKKSGQDAADIAIDATGRSLATAAKTQELLAQQEKDTQKLDAEAELRRRKLAGPGVPPFLCRTFTDGSGGVDEAHELQWQFEGKLGVRGEGGGAGPLRGGGAEGARSSSCTTVLSSTAKKSNGRPPFSGMKRDDRKTTTGAVVML